MIRILPVPPVHAYFFFRKIIIPLTSKKKKLMSNYAAGAPVVIVLEGSGATPAAAVAALNTAITTAQANTAYVQYNGPKTSGIGQITGGPIFTGLQLTAVYDTTTTAEVWAATVMMQATAVGTENP